MTIAKARRKVGYVVLYKRKGRRTEEVAESCGTVAFFSSKKSAGAYHRYYRRNSTITWSKVVPAAHIFSEEGAEPRRRILAD